MAAIDTIYNYYLSTYGSNTQNRYDTHKKSELRSVYNNMLKVNKESPLYKISTKDLNEVAKYAIDVKESSLNFQKVSASLTGDDNSLEGSFKKRLATSSDEDHVSVSYVGEESDDTDLNTSFDLEVRRLAGPQINIGKYLPSIGHDFEEGQYSFDFENTANAYEFQYTVGKDDSNLDVQQKLAKLINTANVGAEATIDKDADGHSALIITSKETGLAEEEEFLFKITPSMDYNSQWAMNILGINDIAKEAQNSSFLLNGEEHNSLANTFTINNQFEVSLNAVSEEGKAATIGFANDMEAIFDNVNRLVEAYNKQIHTANSYNNGSQQHNQKLIHDLSSASSSMKNELESIGLIVGIDGTITIDKGVFDVAVSQDSSSEIFSTLNEFKMAATARASQISLNPMEYVNKTVVAYKNPGRTFNTPYANSMYVGLLLDQYA